MTITAGATSGSGFHLLAKPTGATCNLDCEYCFFLSKEMLYPGSRFRMADDLLETGARRLEGILEEQRLLPERQDRVLAHSERNGNLKLLFIN